MFIFPQADAGRGKAELIDVVVNARANKAAIRYNRQAAKWREKYDIEDVPSPPPPPPVWGRGAG